MTEIIPDPDIKEFDGVYVGGKKRLPPNEYNLSRLAEYLRKTNKKFSDLSKEEKKHLFCLKTAHSSERFSYTRVQLIALDLNTNFAKQPFL